MTDRGRGGCPVITCSSSRPSSTAASPSRRRSSAPIRPSSRPGRASGFRALTGEETLARALVTGLAPDERAIAVVDPVAPPDIRSGHGRRARLDGIPTGIRHDELDAGAGGTGSRRLIRHYLGRARDDVASRAWERLADGGPGRAHVRLGRPARARARSLLRDPGPSLLIEYDNTQDDANHIHSVWRDLDGDWGEDLLAEHYRAAHD